MPVKECAISIQTLSRNVLLNERMRKNNVAGRQRNLSVLLFCWRLFSTPRLSNWWFDIAEPIISLVKLSMHKQGSLMLGKYSMGVGTIK